MKCLLIFIINPVKKEICPTFQMQKLRFRELKALAQGTPEPRIQAEFCLPLFGSFLTSLCSATPNLCLSLYYPTTEFLNPFMVTSQGEAPLFHRCNEI